MPANGSKLRLPDIEVLALSPGFLVSASLGAGDLVRTFSRSGCFDFFLLAWNTGLAQCVRLTVLSFSSRIPRLPAMATKFIDFERNPRTSTVSMPNDGHGHGTSVSTGFGRGDADRNHFQQLVHSKLAWNEPSSPASVAAHVVRQGPVGQLGRLNLDMNLVTN